MNKQTVSPLQFSILIIGFLFGTSIILSTSPEAKQDSWITVIIGGTSGISLFILFYYFYQRFPELTIFQYQQKLLGKKLGKLINYLYIWFFVHLAAIVLTNFWFFMCSTFYPTTSPVVIGLFLMVAITYAIYVGIEAIARTEQILIPIIPISLVIIYSLLWKEYNLENLLPIGENGIKPILSGSLGIFTFPFGETIAFGALFPYIKQGNKNKTKKIFISTLFIMMIFGTISTMLNILILGSIRENSMFPFVDIVRLVNVLGFLERIDAFVMLIWVISVFSKLSILVFAAIIGFRDTFEIEDYRPIVLPVSSLVMTLSYFLYNNIVEMNAFAFSTWPFYSLVFELLIPIILLITLIFKNNKLKNNR
ncbi:hypothetical protein BHF71_09025 [Vulcanibacillus modesticaldus]|uniref:Uncharacterized protein n=1 Tax=Vulcanibacillus modesticaldus TaxID=337097 RepID=A0A1D2YUU5_9BACI|nr:endospore germination permease [Vulcanibacillus modesticaldus]OEF99443.1 hypothetical protein BHF71_09025 [Vulcanibacillus modesticaldus]